MVQKLKKYRMYGTIYATVYADVVAHDEDEAIDLFNDYIHGEDYCNQTVGAEAEYESWDDIDSTIKVDIINVEGAELDKCSTDIDDSEDVELEFEDEDEDV